MEGGANHKGNLNLTTTSSSSSQQPGCGVSVTTGTNRAFNNHGNGSQNFKHAVINSGANSGQNQASNENSTSQILPNSHCSGTLFSFNSDGEGNQDFGGAIINSGANSGNPPRSGSRPTTTSEQQHRVTVSGTRNSFNNASKKIKIQGTEAREAGRKAIEDMSEETKAAFENMRFHKFCPVQSPDAPDVSNVKEHDRITMEQLHPAPTTYDILGSLKESSEQEMWPRTTTTLVDHRKRLRHPEKSISISQHTTRPPTTATASTISVISPATQHTYYPPYPPCPPYPYPPYPYPPSGYPPYPYPPQGYPLYLYPSPSYPPYPSQSGPSSDPSHRPPHSDLGSSH